ncbi:DNA topology modulation protein FlaR [Deinococcus planocerae]|uniref:DNA topology modulation protein FlaR n=1 Tax=Deinococcus planocerae TaxID=1737569 RepID=UPI000C7EA7D0|nr:DNA topology modulation protein FlaR [Deinococcus planocerae]
MRRVPVIGCPGAGKSTFARRLAARMGLPLTHLDELYWHPGWKRVEPSMWHRRLAEVLGGEAWILDGNFSSTLLERAYRADTVFFLRPPRRVCLWRAFWREALGRHPHGDHPAKWPSRALLLDIWQFQPQADWQLTQLRTVPGLRVNVLHSDAEVRAVLRRLG